MLRKPAVTIAFLSGYAQKPCNSKRFVRCRTSIPQRRPKKCCAARLQHCGGTGRRPHFRFDSGSGKGKNVAEKTAKRPPFSSLEMNMSASNAIVVASAARTPVGSFNGSFANTPAHELGVVVINEVLARAGVDGAEVDE